MELAGHKIGGLDTSDATATESDLTKPKTAYVNGVKITGTGKPFATGTITGTGQSTFSVSGLSFSPAHVVCFTDMGVNQDVGNAFVFAESDFSHKLLRGTDHTYQSATTYGTFSKTADGFNMTSMTPYYIKSGDTLTWLAWGD